MKKFVNYKNLSEITGLPVRTIRSLKTQRKIPFIRVGYRTHLFDPEKVIEALGKFEIKAVGQIRENVPVR